MNFFDKKKIRKDFVFQEYNTEENHYHEKRYILQTTLNEEVSHVFQHLMDRRMLIKGGE